LPLAAGSDVFLTGDTPTAVIARRVAGRNATAGDSDRRSTDGITVVFIRHYHTFPNIKQEESSYVTWLFSIL